MDHDVLELMVPSAAEITVYDAHAEVESLRFLDWFRFDDLLVKCFTAFVKGRMADGLDLMGTAMELAVGLPTSEIDAGDALTAFVVLGKLNELRYIDPDLAESSVQTETEERLKNFVLVELTTTLASRFSVDEILDMTPEFAILCWQRIREEIGLDRDTIFYSTELGYNRSWINKKKGKYKLLQRPSPYMPIWQKKQRKRLRALEIEMQKGYVPRLVSDRGGVIDGKTGKTLREIGEINEQEEI